MSRRARAPPLPVQNGSSAGLKSTLMSDIMFAEKTYNELVKSTNLSGMIASNLRDDKSLQQSKLRGAMLRRRGSAGASYNDLWTGRLQFDVEFSSIELRPNIRTIHEKSDKLSKKYGMKSLTDSTIILLKAFSPEQSKLFRNRDMQFPAGIVCALFGHKHLANGRELERTTFDQRMCMIRYCIANCKAKAKVTLKLMLEAHAFVVQSTFHSRTAPCFGELLSFAASKGFFDTQLDVDRISSASNNAGELGDYHGEIVNEYFDKNPGELYKPRDSTTGAPIPLGKRKIEEDKKRKQILATDPSILTEPLVVTFNAVTVTEDHSFRVWVVYEPFSEAFWSSLEEGLDKLMFMVGTGGKANAYVRVSTNTGAPLTIAQRFAYASQPLTGIEERMLSLANFICRFQTAMVDNVYGKQAKITWHNNLLFHVIASLHDALFAKHSDYSSMLCADPGKPIDVGFDEAGRQLTLAERENLQVASLSLSNSPVRFPLSLKYTDNQGNVVATVPISKRCMHFQSAHSNAAGLEHESFANESRKNGGDVWRFLCTFRLSVYCGPEVSEPLYRERYSVSVSRDQEEPIDEYSFWNARSRCTAYSMDSKNKKENGDADADAENGSDEENEAVSRKRKGGKVKPKPAAKKRKKPPRKGGLAEEEQSDAATSAPALEELGRKVLTRYVPNGGRYVRISDNLFRSMGLYRPGPSLKLSSPLPIQVQRKDFVRLLLEENFKTHIQDVKSGMIIPVLHEIPSGTGKGMQFPIPGDVLKLSSVCADAGLRHQSKSHPIINSKRQRAQIMIITKAYKNVESSFIDYISALASVRRPVRRRRGDILPEHFAGQHSGRLTICGSGGTGTTQGTQPPTPATSNRDDAHVDFPDHQTIQEKGGINEVLKQLSLEEGVVAVYVNQEQFWASATHKVPPQVKKAFGVTAACGSEGCLFLGYFWCSGITTKADKLSDLMSEYGRAPQTVQEWVRFRLNPHIKAEFTPLLDNSEWKREVARREDGGVPLKAMVVPSDCIRTLTKRIELGQGPASKSLGEGAVFHRDFYLEFVRDGLAKEYLPLDKTIHRGAAPHCDDDDDDDDFGEDNAVDSDSDIDSDNNNNDANDCNGDGGTDPRINRDDTTETAARRRGTSCSVRELVNACVLNNAAGAMRSKGHSLFEDEARGGLECAGPLEREELGANLRLYPYPMSNRSLDVVVLYLRREAIAMGLLTRKDGRRRIGRVPKAAIQLDQLADLVFAATLLRFTGRVHAYETYRDYREEAGISTGGLTLPKRQDVAELVRFMRATLVKGSQTVGLYADWISYQHDKAIPQTSKKIEGFAQFIQFVATNMEKTVKDMKKARTRKKAIDLLRQFFAQGCPGANIKSSLVFLAQLVVSDVEEIVDFPFKQMEVGTVGSVVAGHAGREGYEMLRRHEGGPESLECALEAIVDCVRNDLGPDELNILGLVKKREGVVVDLVTLRPYSWIDAENLLCKGWKMAKHTFNHYRNSLRPSHAIPHCHPCAAFGRISATIADEVHSHFMETLLVMDQIVKAFEEMVTKGLLPSADFILMPGENDALIAGASARVRENGNSRGMVRTIAV